MFLKLFLDDLMEKVISFLLQVRAFQFSLSVIVKKLKGVDKRGPEAF